MNSILNSVKKLIGLTEEYRQFDEDLIIHINSVFSILYQLGVGKEPFSITDERDQWEDFMNTEDDMNIQDVKSYVYFRTKLMFDPPTNSVLMEAINKQIAELEWRLNVEADDWEEKNGQME